MLQFKHTIVNAFGWSLHDIDETSIESLFAFFLHKEAEFMDPNTRYIDGQMSKRFQGQGAPPWL